MRVQLGLSIGVALAAGVVVARAAGSAPRTQITVWAAAGDPGGEFGGLSYGGTSPRGGLVTERRELEIVGGEARLAGVAATLDPTSVAVADLTDPDAAVTEQRFLPGAASPTELLARHVGQPIELATVDGDRAGVLRAVDDKVVVVETGAADQRRLELYQRDGGVRSVRWPAGDRDQRPSLAWRLHTRKPGRHTVELSYRADGLSWTAAYVAVLNEAGTTVDFAARATIKNTTGAAYDDAAVTLIGAPAPRVAGATGHPAPARYPLALPVRLGVNEAVQVDLAPVRTAAPAHHVVTLETERDPSDNSSGAPATDCSQGLADDHINAELALELDTPSLTLPVGPARLYQRRAGGVELVSDEPLRPTAGLARIAMGARADVTESRHAATCSYDEPTQTLRESIELTIENAGATAVDVVIREAMWRWTVWRIEREDRKGVRAAPGVQEYRAHVPPHGSQRVTYTVVYTW